MVTAWRAHYSSVTSMDIIHVPPSVLTASKDRRVRIWDRHGNYYGTLRQAEGVALRSWNFPLDEELRKQVEAKKVEEVIQYH
jgi:hypothetical protein